MELLILLVLMVIGPSVITMAYLFKVSTSVMAPHSLHQVLIKLSALVMDQLSLESHNPNQQKQLPKPKPLLNLKTQKLWTSKLEILNHQEPTADGPLEITTSYKSKVEASKLEPLTAQVLMENSPSEITTSLRTSKLKVLTHSDKTLTTETETNRSMEITTKISTSKVLMLSVLTLTTEMETK